jgi:XTP/dITP diphosphohydrolase
MTLCFASNNKHKIEEIADMLGDAFVLRTLNDIGCHDEIPETADTIEGNSLLKAQYVWERYQINCFADDSGLEVAALGGAPGVLSARYAGEHGNHNRNIDLLLSNLDNNTNRTARFKTVITLIIEGQVLQFTGILEGKITAERRGTNGFGYDPIFELSDNHHTLAEMTLTEKSKISHRARAFEQLTTHLTQLQPSHTL